MLSIVYNKKDSYKDFGLVVVGTILRPTINPCYETYNIPGRNGSLNIFKYFNDNEITVNFGFKTKENIITIKSKIIQWLNSEECRELIISDDRTVFYTVNKVSISGFDGYNLKTFSCTFTVNPFINLQEGNNVIVISSHTSLCNVRSNVESYPYIKVYANGNVSISINSQNVILKNIEEFIEIDSREMNCYKTINGLIVNMNDRMYSAFPILVQGENIISWSGNVSKIEIIPRWCCK